MSYAFCVLVTTQKKYVKCLLLFNLRREVSMKIMFPIIIMGCQVALDVKQIDFVSIQRSGVRFPHSPKTDGNFQATYKSTKHPAVLRG